MGTLKVRESGAWNPIGVTNADEVWVGPDTPVSPAAELWYDTDEESSSAVDQTIAWNNAWGVIAEARWSSSWSSASTSAQTITAATGTNTFTAYLYASRRYRLYWQGMVSSTAAGDYIVLQHQINGAAHTENNAQYIAAANVQVFTWVESRYIPPADGNYTFVMTGRRSSASTGTVSVINTGNNPLWLMIEDLGPISRVGVSPPAGQPLATALGNAIGVVAVGDTTNSLVSLTVGAPGVAVTTAISFTPQVGRRYRVKYQVRAIACSDNASGYVYLSIDGTAPSLGDSWFSGTTNYAGRMFDWILLGDGLTHVYQCFGVINAGTISFHNQSSAGNCYFFIEDIGPTSFPPLPVTLAPTPWIPVVAFLNGWSNYDISGSWIPAGYRKVGDEVSVRGLIKSGPVGSAVFSLPVGYRPAQGHIFACDCANSTHVRVDVGANGEVFVQSPMAGGNTGYVSLTGIRFSVTR
jgi:hypothetical protein